MKKALSIVLATAMTAASLAGCSGGGSTGAVQQTQANQTAAEAKTPESTGGGVF